MTLTAVFELKWKGPDGCHLVLMRAGEVCIVGLLAPFMKFLLCHEVICPSGISLGPRSAILGNAESLKGTYFLFILTGIHWAS